MIDLRGRFQYFNNDAKLLKYYDACNKYMNNRHIYIVGMNRYI
jgi:hypothetical protein